MNAGDSQRHHRSRNGVAIMDEIGLLEPFDRMLADLFSSATLRPIGRAELAPEIWITLASSGFLDALVCEESGGAHLSFAHVLSIFVALGRRAVPPTERTSAA